MANDDLKEVDFKDLFQQQYVTAMTELNEFYKTRAQTLVGNFSTFATVTRSYIAALSLELSILRELEAYARTETLDEGKWADIVYRLDELRKKQAQPKEKQDVNATEVS